MIGQILGDSGPILNDSGQIFRVSGPDLGMFLVKFWLDFRQFLGLFRASPSLSSSSSSLNF